MSAPISIRRTIRESDYDGIVDLHDRVYRSEWGRNEEFVAAVAANVAAYRDAGWPERGGAVWLIDRDDWGTPISYQHYRLDLPRS